MASSVELREDQDASALRDLAKRSRDSRQIRRLLALAAGYDGMSRAEAAKVGGMDRQTLRGWAHRFNAEGPEGLRDRPRAGRPRQLSDAQMAELAEIVETGPDPTTDGVIRWRRIDLKRVIEERFGGHCQTKILAIFQSPKGCRKLPGFCEIRGLLEITFST